MSAATDRELGTLADNLYRALLEARPLVVLAARPTSTVHTASERARYADTLDKIDGALADYADRSESDG